MTVLSSRVRSGALLALTLLSGGLAGAATAARPPLPEPTVLDHAAQVGRGEKLILVVAGRSPTEAAARAAAAALSMGDVAGFYVDAASNYRLLGVYDQTNADVLAVDCAGVADAPQDCATTGRTLRAPQDVRLRYVPEAGVAALLTAPRPGCGVVGAAPCIAERLGRILSSGRLDPSSWLVLSAFRTRIGAEQWATWARDHGATVVAIRVVKLGGGYVGLGQEPHPDGSGPMFDPPVDPDAAQR